MRTTMGDPVAEMWEELEEAKAEIERLRGALQEIIEEPFDSAGYDDCKRIAREALDYGLPTADDVRGILSPYGQGGNE
jgi:hypothetical protein